MPENSTAAQKPPFLVGIGSSAGGLEALRELVSTLPPDNGCSYVVVQHMSPQHKSLLTSLIASETELGVKDATDDIEPEPDTIYVTPPRNDIILAEGKLRLVPPSEDVGKPKPSVDRFLMSLAADRGDRSMALILSGTGSDGAYGVQAIREAGGITIAQDDASAKYDGMPNAAIETGCIDLVLRPSDVGLHLKKILSSPSNVDQFRTDQGEMSPVSGILQIVLARTRVDFREYKQSTVLRRIDRRMTALGIASIEDYVTYCRNTPREVDALFKDLLISVTRFFRDRDEFETLDAPLRQLVADRGDRPLRVWVAGCATGEEVYSIAIMLAEAMGGPGELVRSKTQIFATDIDNAALAAARRGRYSDGALLDVPKHLADKYFIQQSEGVRVIEALRSVILFSDHNLCQDPPFLNMDLICCRNLLIYFGSKLQSKVFSRLHYALRQTGLLFLGTAESIAGSERLFSESEHNAQIFRKRQLGSAKVRDKSQGRERANSKGQWTPGPTRQLPTMGQARRSDTSAERQMFDALARSMGENAVLVASDQSFLRVYGDLSPYIDLSEHSSLTLQLSLLKSPFREEARSLVTLALKHSEKRIGARHPAPNDPDRVVRLEAVPIQTPQIEEKLVLLALNSWTASEFAEFSDASNAGKGLSETHLRELDQELATTREALQQTIEELETSNEELQALNEELQSTNEELQATNEELETSNEELQSTNEELITVNEELQVNTSELMGLNAELGSILGNVPIPLLVLDNALQIARASNSALQMFNISTPLRNPHLSQIYLPEGFPRLVEICNEALQTGQPITRDFETPNGPYTLQCAPFTGDGGQMIGTTLVFLRAPLTHALATELSQLISNAPIYLLQYGEDGTVTRISSEMAKFLGVDPTQVGDLHVDALLDGRMINDDAALTGLMDRIFDTAVFPLKDSRGHKRWFSGTSYDYLGGNQREQITVVLATEFTELMDARHDLEARSKGMTLLQEASGIGFWHHLPKTGELVWSKRIYEIHGKDPQSFEPNLDNAIGLYHPDDRNRVAQAVAQAVDEQKGYYSELRLNRGDGQYVWVEARCSVLVDEDGKTDMLVGSFGLSQSEHFFATMHDQIEDLRSGTLTGFISFDVETGFAFWSPSVYNLLMLGPETAPGAETLAPLLDASSRKRMLAERQLLLSEGKPLDEMLQAKINDQKVKLHLRLNSSVDSAGKVTNYYGFLSRVRDK